MFYKISSVAPAGEFLLQVVFQNGKTKYFDVSKLFAKWEAFQALKDTPGLFQLVKVDPGGYGISWNDSIDLGCNDLWEYGMDTMSEVERTL